MKNTLALFICLHFLLLNVFSCKTSSEFQKTRQYSLTGRVSGLPDGTLLYLREVLSNRIYDSSIVRQNRFIFRGTLPANPTQMFLHTADYSAAKSLWLEPGHMVLRASDTSWEEASLSGSITQAEAEVLYARQETTEDYDEQIAIALDFATAYPASRVSAAALSGYAQNIGKERVRTFYEALSAENKASVYGKRILRFLELYKEHQTGGSYTDFSMVNPAGNPLRLSEHLGRVTLLEFWASWCGPCREENPELVKIYQTYHPKGLEIFAVSLDFSEEDWLKAIEKDGLPWPQVSELRGRDSTGGIIYGVNQIPDNFLIDKNGIIVGRALWGKELVAAVEKLLAESD